MCHSDGVDTWEMWNTFRCLCGHHYLLGILLEMTPDLPSAASVERFYGEPVQGIIVPVECFITNEKGFPVMSKRFRTILEHFLSTNVQVNHHLMTTT